MNKTIFEITKMDCPSEENLIRMKLDGISSIENLDFDIPNRKLTVFHNGEIDQIEKSVLELNLGGKKISTEQTHQTKFKETANQKRLLWTVLAINFAFFLIEMTTGLFPDLQEGLNPLNTYSLMGLYQIFVRPPHNCCRLSN